VANHKSAEKRARQNLKRRARNRAVRTLIKGEVKSVRSAVQSGSAEDAISALRHAERSIRKAASKGVISKKQASRRVARLARRVHRKTASAQ
jgi:small subunit ribosomal protein S20